jgi:hypothetical protein
MEGAAARLERERAMVWWGAMMPRLRNPPSFSEFTGTKQPERKRDWRVELSKWQAYVAAKGH